jgi:uncharacterized protein
LGRENLVAYYILTYEVVDNYEERRTPYRPEHLELIQEMHGRGELVMAGAVGQPLDGALLVFRGDDPSAAENFARNDPYVKNGLVTNWTVKPWNVVISGE